ncbi:hypothetical protein B0T17DRAFT_507198 [Bombardia bombarda]|uniref:Uncharacterized protein n=1 Tax=Bombardia bombarda TaxID=252184 RepID=A0AA40C9T5_9PEZI|nr:hypothetical protein B0T17DRAFT_507198 [Bombardia bombarda]
MRPLVGGSLPLIAFVNASASPSLPSSSPSGSSLLFDDYLHTLRQPSASNFGDPHPLFLCYPAGAPVAAAAAHQQVSIKSQASFYQPSSPLTTDDQITLLHLPSKTSPQSANCLT